MEEKRFKRLKFLISFALTGILLAQIQPVLAQDTNRINQMIRQQQQTQIVQRQTERIETQRRLNRFKRIQRQDQFRQIHNQELLRFLQNRLEFEGDIEIRLILTFIENFARYAEDINNDGVIDEKDRKEIINGYDSAIRLSDVLYESEISFLDWDGDGEITELDQKLATQAFDSLIHQ